MIKTLVAAAFAMYSVAVFAQGKYSQKLYAYKEIHKNTNIFITDTTHTGLNGSFINYSIYIELPQKDTSIWNAAIIGNDVYTVHSTLIEKTPVVVGERKTDKRLIKIRSQPVNRLWKLEFDLTGEKVPPSEAVTEGVVVLKGTFKNKKVTSTVRGIVELESP